MSSSNGTITESSLGSSETTYGSSTLSSGRPLPSSSGSSESSLSSLSSLSSSCCHIQFAEDPVNIAWIKYGQYEASSNLSPATTCHSLTWGIIAEQAQISAEYGLVSFGDIGEITTIIAGNDCLCATDYSSQEHSAMGAPAGPASAAQPNQPNKQFTLNIIRAYICRDGQRITTFPVSVDAGERLNLSLEVEPGFEFSDVQWSVTGNKVHDYVPLNALSQPRISVSPVYLKEDDYRQTSLSFCWVSGGDQAVSLSLICNGQNVVADASFEVYKPQPDVSVRLGYITLMPEANSQLLAGRFGFEDPITFTSNLIPEDKGILAWAQTLSNKRWKYNGEEPVTTIEEVGLDNDFPYAPGNIAIDFPATEYAGPYMTLVRVNLEFTM